MEASVVHVKWVQFLQELQETEPIVFRLEVIGLNPLRTGHRKRSLARRPGPSCTFSPPKNSIGGRLSLPDSCLKMSFLRRDSSIAGTAELWMLCSIYVETHPTFTLHAFPVNTGSPRTKAICSKNFSNKSLWTRNAYLHHHALRPSFVSAPFQPHLAFWASFSSHVLGQPVVWLLPSLLACFLAKCLLLCNPLHSYLRVWTYCSVAFPDLL